MSNMKANTPGDVAASPRAEDENSGALACLPPDFTTLPSWRQARIAPRLGCGKAVAVTGRELAALLAIKGCDPSREVGALVERERAAGIPICASTDATRPGYYLPATAAELAEYRCSLQRRVAAVTKTLRAIEDAHDDLTGQQRMDMEATE